MHTFDQLKSNAISPPEIHKYAVKSYLKVNIKSDLGFSL